MFRLARPRNGACCPRRWYRRTEKTRRLRSEFPPNGTKWSLPAKQAGEHSCKAPEYLKKLAVQNLHLYNDINMLNGGGGGGIRTHGTLTRTTVFECGERRVRSVLKHLIWFGLSPAPVITEQSLRCGVLPSNVKSAANSAQRVSAGTRPRLFQKRLRCRTRT